MNKLNKKFLIVVFGIIGVTILIIVFVAIFRACNRKTSNYSSIEKKLVSAAKKYYKANEEEIPGLSENSTITASELTEAGYIKGLSEYLTDDSCTGSVTIYNNGGQYLLIPNLKCDEYQTVHLSDKIIKDNLVSSSTSYEDTGDGLGETNTEEEQINEETDETEQAESNEENNSNVTNNEISRDYVSGLYEMDGLYVFRGKDTNNYISFGNTTWRILDIDGNGLIRVVKNESESRPLRWDTKYNVEISKNYGINDYKNSYILEELNKSYMKFQDSNKSHLMPFNVCVGRREESDVSLNRSSDCSTVLEDQYIGLVSSSDYARASLDENCNSITAGSCSNYNYLSKVLYQTWTSTAVTRSTYEAIYINSGIAASMETRTAANYNWVIALNGKELYTKGSGTLEDPYVIETPKK